MKKAFSLMEVMIVLVILGLLASIALPKYQNYLDKGKYKTSQLSLKKVAEALEQYHAEHGQYPPLQTWEQAAAENSVLLEYLTEVPKTDKWNRPYDIKAGEQDYKLTGKSIPNPKLASSYPDYTITPGPVLKQATK